MSKRVKHSKIKNTGILFEVTSRQITQDIISDDKKSKSIDLPKNILTKKPRLVKKINFIKSWSKTNYNSTGTKD